MFIEHLDTIILHVPKTGGNSVARHVAEHYGAEITLKERDRHTFELSDSSTDRKHQSLREYQARLGDRFSNVTVVWVWRDPAHRLASWYFSRHRLPRSRLKRVWFSSRLSYENFVSFCNQKKSITQMLTLENGPLPRKIIRLDFANLAQDFHQLELSHFRRPETTALPHINSSFSPQKKEAFAARILRDDYLASTHHASDYLISPGALGNFPVERLLWPQNQSK